MIRSLLYDIETVNDIKELDFLSGDMSDFTFKRQVQYHIVTSMEVGRYDLISRIYYGNDDWWWIIAAANEILNPLDEIILGRRLIIPNVLDVYDFYQERRRR